MSALHLLLLRHAKSSWPGPEITDEARPLAQRGTSDATAMGKYMAKAGLVPNMVLCSTAHRIRGTWERVAREFPTVPDTEFFHDMYDFGDGSRLLSIIRNHGGSAPTLMLVGHNPAIEGLARSLVGSGSAILRKRLDQKYPTGALAVIVFESPEWGRIAQGSGTLLNFMRPKDLLLKPAG